jgi:hypothetical protein
VRFRGDQVVSPSPDVVSRVLDGEAVLLDLASGRYFGLNEVGTRAFELAAAPGRRVEEICTLLLQEFEVPADVLRDDIDELLSALYERGLVRVE